MATVSAINDRVITGNQIRAARAILRWSVNDLADRSGLSWATVQRMESPEGVPSANVLNLLKVKSALEKAGIIFIENGEVSQKGGPGVRAKS